MSILRKPFGASGNEDVANRIADKQNPAAYAGDCCELCKNNFKGERNWGFECPSCISRLPNRESFGISARFCYECLAKRCFRAMPPDPCVLRSMKNMIERTCPQCNGPLMDSIL